MDEFHKILCAMEVDKEVKAELTTYQLKDVVYIWYQMWAYSRARGDVPITWDFLKTDILGRFFNIDQ